MAEIIEANLGKAVPSTVSPLEKAELFRLFRADLMSSAEVAALVSALRAAERALTTISVLGPVEAKAIAICSASEARAVLEAVK